MQIVVLQEAVFNSLIPLGLTGCLSFDALRTLRMLLFRQQVDEVEEGAKPLNRNQCQGLG